MDWKAGIIDFKSLHFISQIQKVDFSKLLAGRVAISTECMCSMCSELTAARGSVNGDRLSEVLLRDRKRNSANGRIKSNSANGRIKSMGRPKRGWWLGLPETSCVVLGLPLHLLGFIFPTAS